MVGVDGSEGTRALDWAVDEAARRRARLDVVHVWNYAWVVSASGAASPGVGREEYAALARRALADASRRAARSSPRTCHRDARSLFRQADSAPEPGACARVERLYRKTDLKDARCARS